MIWPIKGIYRAKGIGPRGAVTCVIHEVSLTTILTHPSLLLLQVAAIVKLIPLQWPSFVNNLLNAASQVR